MAPATTPTPLPVDSDESTEPPPSTRSPASPSPQPCQAPPQAQRASPACTRVPAAPCSARTSRSARASSACRGCQSAAAGRRARAAIVMSEGGRRRIALKRMRMEGIATSGCSMTLVSRMRCVGGVGRFLDGSIEKEEDRCEGGIEKHVTAKCGSTISHVFMNGRIRNEIVQCEAMSRLVY